ncbi:MAG: transglycosylase domain-containing protein [Solirubrobacteraceae bacterium]
MSLRDLASSNGAAARVSSLVDRLRGRRTPDGPARPKVKKLRLALILAGLGTLAFISTMFGMMMAVAADLPKLEDSEQFRNARNSQLLDVHGKPLGILTGSKNVVLVSFDQIAPVMRNAIIAVEDKRFYQNKGIDLKGMGRALYSDLIAQKSLQGGSTITQQFVKNALSAQNNRTVFEKLREAALAYHLTRKWSKDKILTEYLNSTYFGQGAYGIESAARTYFAQQHEPCGRSIKDPCARQLRPAEAALLAGIVASPTAFDPIAHPVASTGRRNLVLRDMRDQGSLTEPEYQSALREALPTQNDLTPPQEKTQSPYFTSWARQQIVNKFGPTRAFAGGLNIKTSLDLDLQRAAEKAVSGWLGSPGDHPSAALVAIDNLTGEVRAMVGGSDYARSSFNLATQGQRQPGSSFKPFTLAAALEKGFSPDSTFSSRQKSFKVPGSRGGTERFVVNNFGNSYTGSNTLAGAMTVSDNSVYAEVGIKVGVPRIARLAQDMGIRTPISHNYATTLGGLKEGVTPLALAHAYETFATGGRRVSDTDVGAGERAPIAVHEVRDADNRLVARNKPQYDRVLPRGVAGQVGTILQSVVQSGTGWAAAIPGFAAGKTGTTENYGDAWFAGWNNRLTVAVWVGYPQSLKSMKTDFRGGPVEGGTYPALIWHDFMSSALDIFTARHPQMPPVAPLNTAPTTTVPTTTVPTTTAPATTAPATPTTPTTTTPPVPAPAQTPTRRVAPQPTPAPAPTPRRIPPRTGTSQGTGGAGR